MAKLENLLPKVILFILIICGLGISRSTLGDDEGDNAKSESNPFVAFDKFVKARNAKKVAEQRKIVEEAQRLTLYGQARIWARKILAQEPDDNAARAILGEIKTKDPRSGKTIWLNAHEANMAQQKLLFHSQYGWFAEADQPLLKKGKIPSEGKALTPLQHFQAHRHWPEAYTIRSRYFAIKATIPLEIAWAVAADLDAFTAAYVDHFEIEEHEPKQSWTCHLYQTVENANDAGARGDLLKTYGAYFQGKILHVMFSHPRFITAVRHEAGHALNRYYCPGLPQWLEEGIGCYCQFASVNKDYSFNWGEAPGRHSFATTFVNEVKGGKTEMLIDIAKQGHVTTNAHYYSKFRSIVEFFMFAEDRKYRWQFIETLFRKRTPTLEALSRGRDLQAPWLNYVKAIDFEKGSVYPHADDYARFKVLIDSFNKN